MKNNIIKCMILIQTLFVFFWSLRIFLITKNNNLQLILQNLYVLKQYQCYLIFVMYKKLMIIFI